MFPPIGDAAFGIGRKPGSLYVVGAAEARADALQREAADVEDAAEEVALEHRHADAARAR